MYFSLKFISLLSLLVVSSAAKLPALATFDFLNLFMATRDVTSNDPARSTACFNYYWPELSAISDQYQINYNNCVTNRTDSIDNINDQWAPERQQLWDLSNTSCVALEECTKVENSLGYFDCFYATADKNAKSMRTISENASDYSVLLKEEYRLIDNEEKMCTTEAQRTYEVDSVTTYQSMQDCLSGKSEVPKKESSTTTTTEATTVDGD